MSDDLGLFSDNSGAQRRGRQQAREERERFQRRRRRRTVTALAGVFVLLVMGSGIVYVASQFLRIGSYEDYAGAGSGTVVIEVKSGDTTSSVARTLARHDVVASSGAFKEAAETNNDIGGLQPGFYLMRGKMSAQAAVDRIVSPQAKVGRLEIRGGMRLEDQASPNGEPTPGILTKLAQASCAKDAKRGCVTSEQMHEAAQQTGLAELGAPSWAIGPASNAEPKRRLEGLIMPGVYDIKPGANARELLRSVVSDSAARLEATGLTDAARKTGLAPYEMLTIASLAQSEAIEPDFAKVARVIYNRRAIQMPLQFDSTINYPLDKPALLTKSEDRLRPGPYNTYRNVELPPTPISSASKEAIRAAENPAPGRWIFFVKCYKDGKSCFSESEEQHDTAKREAQQRGAY